MARNNNKFTPKSGAGTLRPLSDADIAPQASRLEGRKLVPVPYRPEANRPNESDGAPLSRFGWRFREVFAQEHGIKPELVELGIIRQVEALNADTDRNMAALSAVETKRTEHGTLRQVRLVVNTPLLFPWLLNGRALRRMGAELRGGTARLVTAAEDHDLFALPVMRVENADTVLEIVAAQRRLLGLSNYTNADGVKKDRIDSIVQFGVLDPPDVVMTQLVSSEGSAWVAQAAEGAQRLFSALLAMDVIANRNVAHLATDRWLRTEPARLRDITPEDLHGLPDALKFSSTAAAGYFPGSDIETWVNTIAATTPAAVAFQLLRTMEINLIVAVNPDPVVTKGLRNPVSDTIQELIRGYHMPGKSKEQWKDADVLGLIAIGAIDELVADGRVRAEERSQWLGETLAEWNGPAVTEYGLPGNLLATVTKMLGAITAQGALPPTEDSSNTDSLEIVNHHLRLNSTRVHSDDRAKVAAAQAIATLGLHGSGWEGTLQAAIFGTFRHPWFWKTSEHDGSTPWPSLLGMPINELADQARAERAANASSDDPDKSGPAQRAIGALGGVALMANPGLINDRTALSRTGLGAGGQVTQVSATDPSNLLRAMAQFDAGIDELEDAVAALVSTAQPTIPLDREDQEALTDFYLRRRWLGDNRTAPDNPQTEFARRIQVLVSALTDNHKDADELRTILPGALLGLTPPTGGDVPDNDRYAPDLWGDPVYEDIGINETVVEEVLPVLQSLVDFFQVGKAYARAASRAAR